MHEPKKSRHTRTHTLKQDEKFHLDADASIGEGPLGGRGSSQVTMSIFTQSKN